MSENARVLTDLVRLQAVASYDLFHPVLAAELRGVCLRTAERLDMPLAAVQAVLNTSTTALATNGGEGDFLSPLGGTPNEISMCPAVVVTGRPLIAGDLRRSDDFAGTPGVLTGLVLAYAGVPLTSESGELIGTHCVMSPEAREFSAADIDNLHIGAAEVMDILARYRIIE
jgi:GAF domain-containing protein